MKSPFDNFDGPEFDDFGKDLTRRADRIFKLAGWGIVFSMFVSLCFLGGIGWVVFLILRHNGLI